MNTNGLKRLGNFYGPDKGTGYAGNVWSPIYLSPALNTAQGGMRETIIMEIFKDNIKEYIKHE